MLYMNLAFPTVNRYPISTSLLSNPCSPLTAIQEKWGTKPSQSYIPLMVTEQSVEMLF